MDGTQRIELAICGDCAHVSIVDSGRGTRRYLTLPEMATVKKDPEVMRIIKWTTAQIRARQSFLRKN
jgi:hypothetical protein